MTVIHKTPFDVRVVEFHLRNGTISHADYEKYLKDLADETEESEETETTFVPSFELRNIAQEDAAEEPSEPLLLG